MKPKKVLIVEDEPAAREELEVAIKRTSAGVSVDQAATFKRAMELVKQVEYDVIFVDLLLLPGGTHMKNARLVAAGEAHTMDPLERDRYSKEEGGIRLVQEIRMDPNGPNLSTPIVVMTWYIETNGDRWIRRELMLDDDPRLVILPKYSRVTALQDSLDDELRSMCPSLLEPLQRILEACLASKWTPEHSKIVQGAASELIVGYRYTKAMRKDSVSGFPRRGGPVVFQPHLPVETTLRVDIDPLGDSDSIIELLGSTRPGSDELADLYQWPRLRDQVLLNPRLNVELSLHVTLADNVELPPIALPAYRTGPDAMHGLGPSADEELVQRLLERLVLVYLASQSEPREEMGEGWGVTNKALCEMLAIESERHRGMPYYREPWGTARLNPDITAMLGRVEEWTGVTDRIADVQARLREAVRGLGISGELLDQLSDEEGSPSGMWNFCGELELALPDEAWYQPQGLDAHRVAFFALSDEVPFACLGGRYAHSSELELRFREAGMTVERYGSLREIADVPSRFPGATLIVVAPADDELLDSFIDGPARRLWRDGLPERDPLTILVLTDDARVRDQVEMERLRADNIDCMFPSQVEGALDLTKIMDHVICSGYRTRYLGKHVGSGDLVARQAARKRISAVFERLVSEHRYDGDLGSGAASERLPDGGLLITASKTDKLSTDPNDISIVEDMDVVRNVVTWSGARRPSSSTRWHALIYDHLPWANCVLHTHWKALTYSEPMAGCTTAHYRLSGSRREAAEIVSVLATGRSPATVAVLRDHGEVFVGESWESILDLVAETRVAELEPC